MVSFRDAFADAILGVTCSIIAINDDFYRLFSNVPFLNSVNDYTNFFIPLRAQICNEDPADYVPPETPFQGGQCPTSTYRPTGTYVQTNPNAPGEGTTRTWIAPISVQGPIGGVVPAGTPTGTSWALTSGDPPINLQDTATGQAVFGPNPNLSPGVLVAATAPRITDVGLQSGTDDCGDPDIPPPITGPVERPVNITYNTDQGDVVNISGDVTFSPSFSTGDFDLRLPFRFDAGGFTLFGELQISPDFSVTFAPRISFGNGSPIDGPELPPSGDPSTPPPPEPEPIEPAIIGVVIRSNILGEQQKTSIATQGMPTIWAPRIGSCSFAIQTGLVVSWTPDIPVKNRDCYIPCPAPQGAVGVSVSPEPGWSASWRAVRARPLLPPT